MNEQEMASGLEPLDGDAMPSLRTEIPGPRSVASVDVLARGECPAITARRARRKAETGVGQDPIVWSRAKGANVEDVDGNLYVDMTSAFAVAGIGHAHPRVVEAGKRQLDRLIHAMGDVYPSDAKITFLEKLSRVAPGDLSQCILGMSGASAIEAALKTAAVHTGKSGVLAFHGGYHGLSYGALAVTAYRSNFREPFLSQLSGRVQHVPYPDTYRPPFGLSHEVAPEEVGRMCLAHIAQLLQGPASGGEGIGAVVIEPIQGRGGEVEPPAGFLAGLAKLCEAHGVVLIFDEIYTGFARTGDMFACEHEGVLPDILCVGKALGGGVAISAAIGRPEVMASWGSSSGEAVHTSTFLGNPLSCAMASAVLDVLCEEGWVEQVKQRGAVLAKKLHALQREFPALIGRVRGRGYMLGLDLIAPGSARDPNTKLALELMDRCRRRGYLVLPSGVYGNILALSPPFVTTDEQLDGFLQVLREELRLSKTG